MTQTSHGATLRRAVETCIQPDEASIAGLGELFTDDAVVWTPNLLTTSRAELADALSFRENAFTDVAIQFDGVDVFGGKGFVEFRVSANFSGPFVIDEEVTIEPNGRRLVLGAAAVAEFESGKIKALRAYFDDSALLEQMIA